MSSVGQRLIEYLKQHMKDENIDQKTLAEKINVTQGRVSQILKNPGNMTLSTIDRLVTALGLDWKIVIKRKQTLSEEEN